MNRHPTLEECKLSGEGKLTLPDNEEERNRFETYMKYHSWYIGKYDDNLGSYQEMLTRMLYGVWKDRGSLPTIFGE